MTSFPGYSVRFVSTMEKDSEHYNDKRLLKKNVLTNFNYLEDHTTMIKVEVAVIGYAYNIGLKHTI